MWTGVFILKIANIFVHPKLIAGCQLAFKPLTMWYNEVYCSRQ